MPLKLVEKAKETSMSDVNNLKMGDVFKFICRDVVYQKTELHTSKDGWAVSLKGITHVGIPECARSWPVALLPKGTKLEVV